MKKEDYIKLRKKIDSLSKEEKAERDKYLKQFGSIMQGPLVGYPSIDRLWMQYYDDSFIDKIPVERTVYGNLVESSKNHLNSKAISYMGNLGAQYTYKQLIESIDEVAKSFAELGIKKGDKVTFSLANTPEWVIAFYALAKLGAITDFIDPRLKGEKLKYAINSVKPKMLLFTDIFSKELNNVMDDIDVDNIIIVSPYDSLPTILRGVLKKKSGKINLDKSKYLTWKEFVKIGRESELVINDNASIDDPVCIAHTSGTTGTPKGVVLGHRHFAVMANQMDGNGFVRTANGTFLNEMPTFLAYNVFATTNNPLILGLNVVMLPDYKPEEFDKTLLKYKPESLIVGPGDWDSFRRSKRTNNVNLSFVRTAISGSDKIDEDRKQQINDKLKAGGSNAKLLEGYGMTEMCSAAVANVPQAIFPDSVGIPFKNVSMCIYDNDNDMEMGYNEVGEICLTGDTMMMEYFDNPEETKLVKREHPDGTTWIHTGDIGYIDNRGALFLKGRIKNVIVRHDGIKVSPYDIEKVIMHSGIVADCAVVGIKNKEKGHGSVPIANIVLKEELHYSPEVIIDRLKQILMKELGENYQPYAFNIYDELPKTENQKIDYEKMRNDNEELFNGGLSLNLKAK